MHPDKTGARPWQSPGQFDKPNGLGTVLFRLPILLARNVGFKKSHERGVSQSRAPRNCDRYWSSAVSSSLVSRVGERGCVSAPSSCGAYATGLAWARNLRGRNGTSTHRTVR